MTLEDIALQMSYGIGEKHAIALLGIFGCAERIFAASESELIDRAGVRPDIAKEIAARRSFRMAERELAYCRKHGIAAIASTDPAYPPLLRETPDYPHVLYVQGNPEALSARCISIVGTRSATDYGKNMCRKLVEQLAERIPGLCLVSGIAEGIDITVHRTASEIGIPSVAILANALPDVTPSVHAAFARRILAGGGALVSELHSQSKQNGRLYPKRNRLIAGMSAGCIIVESSAGGGAMITAGCASGYDRTLMAVPGRATDRASEGPNLLIRNQKAQLILSGNDVIRALMWDLGVDPVLLTPQTPAPDLTSDETELLSCFRPDEPRSLDTLCALSGFDPGRVQSLLVALELARMVRQLPGNRYEKIR